ncbi:MAG: hypothetical protein ABH834_05045 [Candidatus Altiarchaeota archaeon]
MKNHGRVYKLTSAAVILAAIGLIAAITVAWYMWGYDYVVAPTTLTVMEQAGGLV